MHLLYKKSCSPPTQAQRQPPKSLDRGFTMQILMMTHMLFSVIHDAQHNFGVYRGLVVASCEEQHLDECSLTLLSIATAPSPLYTPSPAAVWRVPAWIVLRRKGKHADGWYGLSCTHEALGLAE